MEKIEIIVFDSKGKLEFVYDELQDIADHEVMVAPKFVGICGSDIHALESAKSDKLFVGHEWVGIVEKVGKDVSGIKIGDKVTSGVKLYCGVCAKCKQGYTEQCLQATVLGEGVSVLRTKFKAPAASLVKLPDESGPEAVLFEILGVAENVFEKVKQHLQGKKKVLILGAGALGQSCGLVFRREGLDCTFIDTIASRVERIKSLGFTGLPLGMAMMDSGLYHSYDVVIDATGDHLNGPGGWKYVGVFGGQKGLGIMLGKYIKDVSFKPDLLFLKEMQLIWVQRCPPEAISKSITEWKGQVKELASVMLGHTFSFKEAKAAFVQAQDRHHSAKVVIEV